MCALALLILSGCAVGPDYVRPEAPAQDHYNYGQDPSDTVAVAGVSQHFEKGAPPVVQWWTLFRSRQLDAAVAEALADNPGLQAAQASLRQSNENLRAGYGIFYPQGNADAGTAREKFSPALFGSTAPGTIFNLTTLSASVSYALDLFGGERRMVEGLASQVDLQRSLTQGTYLVLSGNIVNTLVARAAYQAEIDETAQMIALLQEQIGIAEKQFQAGTAAYGAVLALRSQEAALEAALPPLRQRQSQAEHLLATLEGKPPAAWQPPQVALAELTLPAALPLSLPSELVRQRPDILAAEAQLHAASANIGVATAALFPSFSLNASYGQNSTAMNRLFASNGNFWSLGADVTAPLFNGGTLLSRRQAAQEAYGQSLASYRQTVLAAFAQVADTLRALEHDAEASAAQARSVATAQDTLHLLAANYQAGMINYLQVLAADMQYHQARIAQVQARAQQLQDTSALFVALGGGWGRTPQPETDTVLP